LEEKLSHHLGPDGRALKDYTEDEGGPLSEMRSETVGTRFIRVDNRWVVSEFVCTESSTGPKNKKAEVAKIVYVLKDIRFGRVPIEFFSFSRPIPNGTIVNVFDQSHIPHEWRDGKVVKKADSQHLSPRSKPEFQSDRSWFWPSFAFVSLSISSLLCFALWRWLRARGNA
jgi:hypothetical protein